MHRITIREAVDSLFTITVEGVSVDALAFRRIIGQFTSDPPGTPDAEQVSYSVPRSRLRSLLIALAPHLSRTGIQLDRDAATSRELAAVRAEISSLRTAVEKRLKPARYNLSDNFRRTLTRHQKEAVGRLLALPHGANFSVPGAGKTTVTLAVYDVLRSRGSVSQLLVIAPRNAFQPWEEEITACFQTPPTVRRLAGGTARIRAILAEPETPNCVLLLGYQQAYFSAEVIEEWARQHAGLHLVLDESHKIKNPNRGAWASTVLRFATLASRRDILTGTPAPNATEDLATQLSFLWPFQSVIPEAQLRDPNAETLVTQRLRPLYVRTTKHDLGLPETIMRPVAVQMGTIQRAITEYLMGKMGRAAVPSHLRSENLSALRPHVIRLLQLASNPALVLSDAEEFRIPPIDLSEDSHLEELFRRYHEYELPPKFAYAVKTVETRAKAGNKTIVWSSFVKNLEMLARLLPSLNPVVLHGGVPTALDMDDVPESSREALVHQFKTDRKCFVMIANPAACSESISLHKHCDYALYLDRTFNAAAFLQSMDRIHRLGLARDAVVTYDLLVSPGTIDEVVDRRLGEKIRRLGRLLDDPALRTLDLDALDEQGEYAFDLDDAKEVVKLLQQHQQA